jgi:hypothetical protein
MNQLLKFQSVDWTATGNDTIIFNYDLPVDTEIHFRIDSLPSGSVGGGGSGGGGSDLQSAYNAGNIVNVTSGVPVTLNGSGVLQSINGDLIVTGLIL